jgi:hypothetical protein
MVMSIVAASILSNSPPIIEARSNLGPCNPPRACVTRLALTEAEHEIAASRPYHRRQILHERTPVLVAEYVKEAAVKNGIEFFAQRC